MFGQLYSPQGPDDDQRGRKTEEAGGKKTKGTGQGSKAEKIAPELPAFRLYFLTLFPIGTAEVRILINMWFNYAKAK